MTVTWCRLGQWPLFVKKRVNECFVYSKEFEFSGGVGRWARGWVGEAEMPLTTLRVKMLMGERVVGSGTGERICFVSK